VNLLVHTIAFVVVVKDELTGESLEEFSRNFLLWKNDHLPVIQRLVEKKTIDTSAMVSVNTNMINFNFGKFFLL
jgi:hypothetical protein